MESRHEHPAIGKPASVSGASVEVGAGSSVGGAGAVGGSLTDAVSGGMMWALLQAGATKVITTVQQLALAWLLLPEHMGLVALAGTFMAFATLLQQGGLRQVLIQRHARFDLWATPAFWLGCAQAVLASVVLAACTPLAARLYDEPGLMGVMLVMACYPLLDTLSVVPQAKLQIGMRFRVITRVSVTYAVVLLVLSLACAWAGMGAWSLVLPKVPATLLMAWMMWRASGVRVGLRARVRRWRYMFADSLYVLGGLACANVANQGATIALGRMFKADVVGVYNQASNLSLQTVKMVTMPAEDVLFAGLNKINDQPARQTAAFMRAVGVLATIVMPLCLVQAAVSEDVVRVLLPERWVGAGPLLAVLSLGMAFLAAAMPAHSTLQSQGRFRTYFFMSLVFLVAFVAAMWVGWREGTALGVAWAVAVYYGVTSLVVMCVVVVPFGVPWWRACWALLAPGLLAAVPTGLAWWFVPGFGEGRAGALGHAAVVASVALVGYLALLRVAMPGRFFELRGLFDRLSSRVPVLRGLSRGVGRTRGT